MTNKLVEQGKEHIFYATFVNLDGSSATISGTPTISIISYFNGEAITILTNANMSQVSGSTYAYRYYIGKIALGDYVAKYTASYQDNTIVVSEESFTVCTPDFFQRIKGAGLFKTKIVEKTDKGVVAISEQVKEMKEILDSLKAKEDAGLIIPKIDVAVEQQNNLLQKIDDIPSLFSKSFLDLASRLEIIESKQHIPDNTEILELRSEVEKLKDIVEKMYVHSLTDDEMEEIINGQS